MKHPFKRNAINRRDFIKLFSAGAIGGAALIALPGCTGLSYGKKARFNVLFIVVDDLRPELNCYGASHIKSPNIDLVAESGVLFTRTYCQQAVCNPSRTSVLTGYRPETIGVLDLETHFRENDPDVVTLPEHFKKHGYHTQAFSKVYHPGLDDPRSWSVPTWWSRFPDKYNYQIPEIDIPLRKAKREFDRKFREISKSMLAKEKIAEHRKTPRGPSWAAPDVPDNYLADGECTDEVIRTLREVKDKPFFLAVGFKKPHLPFVAPKKYFDLYPKETIKLANNPFAPKDAPDVALTNWGELRKYSDIPKQGPVSEEKAIELTRAYFACISFIDVQIGRLKNELDTLGQRDNTVIILWGDHGWHLLDHGLWSKHTNYEVATRSPMIISVPGIKTAGQKCDALTEFVDIYPSLCDICGLPVPGHVEGISFKPLLEDPDRSWKKAAFSLYPRKVKGVGKVMGRAIRTDRYRFVEWTNVDKMFREFELYDHKVDPNENVNIANLPENVRIVEKLLSLLHAGWRRALPPNI